MGGQRLNDDDDVTLTGATNRKVDHFLWEIHEKQKQIFNLEEELKTHVERVDDRFVERNMEIDRLLARIERLETKVANDDDFRIEKEFPRERRSSRKPSLQIQRVERDNAGEKYTALSLNRLDAIRESLNAIASLKTIHHQGGEGKAEENSALVLKKCFRRCRELVDGEHVRHNRPLTEPFPTHVTEPESFGACALQPSLVPTRVARARENLSRVSNTLSRVASNSSRVSRSLSMSLPRRRVLSGDSSLG